MEKERRSRFDQSNQSNDSSRLQSRRILRTKEAADKLGLKPCTLEKWRVCGGGPPFVRISARAIGYFEDMLDEWLIQRMLKNTAQV